ncbi:MAG: hypothetical protein AAF639_43490 [Chloroflexota bacterium]
MQSSDPRGYALYHHAQRVTNYFNPHDGVLSLSNLKHLGKGPRLGRIGLPQDVPNKAVNVDTGPYFNTYVSPSMSADIALPHTWYLDDGLFAQDLVHTLQGEIDRNRIPTRIAVAHNQLILGEPQTALDRGIRVVA